MGRRFIQLPTATETEITARTARGESAQTIFEAIGRAISIKTIERRQAVLRGKRSAKQSLKPRAAPLGGLNVAPPGAAANPPFIEAPEDEVPETPDESTPIEQLNRWISKLEAGARKAEENGNLAALASIAAKVAVLMALRHRASPLPKPDPNDDPDFLALAAQGRARLQQLANGLFANQE